MVLAAALPNIDMAIVLTVVWIDEIQRSCTPTPLCLWVTDTAPDTHHDSHLQLQALLDRWRSMMTTKTWKLEGLSCSCEKE